MQSPAPESQHPSPSPEAAASPPAGEAAAPAPGGEPAPQPTGGADRAPTPPHTSVPTAEDAAPVPSATDGAPAQSAAGAASAAAGAPPPAAPAGAIADPAACAAELRARFPALFAGPPKPVKLRIQGDIQQRAPGVFTRQALSAFLSRYTGGTSYLLALVKAEQRYDLDGQGAGEISAEHRGAAEQELARRRELRQQREGRNGPPPRERRDPREDEARRERALLLRDFERTTLTEANFCALKGITREQLQAQLAQARDEAAAWARLAPPRPPPMRDERGPRSGPTAGDRGPRDERGPRHDGPAGGEGRPQRPMRGPDEARAPRAPGGGAARPPRGAHAPLPQGGRGDGGAPNGPRRDAPARGAEAAAAPPAEPPVVVRPDALRRFAALLVGASGGSEREASMVAANLVEANLTGHDSHGVGMLPAYVDNTLAGGLKAGASLAVVTDAGALLTLDGNAGYGQVMAHDAMVLAIERARQHGVAVVGLANSHHIGRIGAWAEQCVAAGLVSVHFVNVLSRPVVAPFNGSDGRFVTNPFCVGIPIAGEAPVVLDFATSRIAVGKARVAMLKGERVRPGTLLDAQGHPSTDPGVLFAEPHGALLPFGEHKGYGLAVVCEILGGALAGGLTLHEPPSPHAIINNMLSFVVDPERLGTARRLADEARAFAAWVQASPPRPGREVMLPGEPERRHRAERSVGGIPIDANSWRSLLDAGRRAGLADETMLAAAGLA